MFTRGYTNWFMTNSQVLPWLTQLAWKTSPRPRPKICKASWVNTSKEPTPRSWSKRPAPKRFRHAIWESRYTESYRPGYKSKVTKQIYMEFVHMFYLYRFIGTRRIFYIYIYISFSGATIVSFGPPNWPDYKDVKRSQHKWCCSKRRDQEYLPELTFGDCFPTWNG